MSVNVEAMPLIWMGPSLTGVLTPRPSRPDGTLAVCDRCNGTEHVDVVIHEGDSIRRDCRCGRVLGFPVWYGKDDDGNPVKPATKSRKPRKKKGAA